MERIADKFYKDLDKITGWKGYLKGNLKGTWRGKPKDYIDGDIVRDYDESTWGSPPHQITIIMSDGGRIDVQGKLEEFVDVL